MKKITLNVTAMADTESADDVRSALDALSGVVAADASAAEGRAYAYAGDRLPD